MDRLYDSGAGGRNARPSTAAEFLESEFVILLKPLERRLELLISVLHLLKLTGELPDLILQAIDPDQKLRGPDLRECGSRAHQGTKGGSSNAV